MNDLQALRKHWTDALAAFGAHIEIHQLPDHIENRQSFSTFLNSTGVDERPVRVVVVGRERVSGAVLVEIDENRERIVQAFSEATAEATAEAKAEKEEAA